MAQLVTEIVKIIQLSIEIAIEKEIVKKKQLEISIGLSAPRLRLIGVWKKPTPNTGLDRSRNDQ